MDQATLDYYQRHADDLAARYEQADVGELQTSLLEHLPSQGTVLEVGCGTGRDAAFLIEQGFEVTAVDASLQMLAVAVRQHPELKGHTFCAELPFQDRHPLLSRRFDAIISIALLMHVSDQDVSRAAHQFAELLNPGGVLFASASETRPGVINERQDDGRIYVERPPDRLENMLVAAGFRRKALHHYADGAGRSIAWYAIVLERL